jgi:hypothetical protein
METKKINKLSKLASAGLLACALFAFAPSAQAQRDDMEARIGIKGGINLSNLYIDDVTDQKAKWGLHGGIFAKIPVAAAFAIQPELLYTTAGNKVGNYTSFSGPQNQVNFNLNYIQLPILASLTAGPVSLQAGPYLSYLVSAKVKNVRVDNNGIPTDTSDGRELNKDDFNTIDYGLAGGLALDIKGFQVGARYNYGLRNVGQSGISGLLTNGSKNSVAQLYIAFGL